MPPPFPGWASSASAHVPALSPPEGCVYLGKDVFHSSACLWPLPAVSLSSRRVRLAQLGSRLENVAETKPRASRQGVRPGTGRTLPGAKSCFPPRSADHCPGGSCSTIMLSFFLQFYCFLPLHLSCRPKGKKSWSVWGPGGWNMRQRTRIVAFLSFSLVKLKKNREKFTHYSIYPLKVYHPIRF